MAPQALWTALIMSMGLLVALNLAAAVLLLGTIALAIKDQNQK